MKGAFCWANFHPLRTHYTANVASSFRVTLSTRPNIGCFLLIDRLAPLGHLSRREGKSNFQENSIVKILAWKHGKQIIMNSGRAHLSRRCLRQVTCSSVAQLRKKIVRIAQCPTRLHFLSSSRVPFYPITPLFLSLLLMLHVEGGGGGGRAPLEIFTSSSLLSTLEAPFSFFFQEGGRR